MIIRKHLNANSSRKVKRNSRYVKSDTSSKGSVLDIDDDELFEIAENYSTSKPVSGDWGSETAHEQKAIADHFHISMDEAKQLMISKLGFTEDEFKNANSSRKVKRNSRYVKSDFEVTLPNDALFDPKDFDLVSHVNHLSEIDKAKSKAAEEAKRVTDLKVKYGDVLDKINKGTDVMNKLDIAFNELVPYSGKAPTKAGELVRAMMRVLYRDYNDGDIFYQGYGFETCGSSICYVGYELGDSAWDKIDQIINKRLEGQEYTTALEELAEDVINYIEAHPDYVVEPNNDDSLSEDTRDLKDKLPRYDVDISLPSEVIEHIHAGHISTDDVIESIKEWLRPYDTFDEMDVEVSYDTIWVNNIDKDGYDEVINNGYDWMDTYVWSLDEDYKDYNSDDE